jgi:riboflavin transporter FmnP
MTATKVNVKQITITAMLCAIAYVSVLLSRFIPNVAGFLSYEPKDAVIVIGGFVFGPMTSMIISVIVSFVEMVTISSTGPYGFIMNVIGTCAFTIPAAFLYKRRKSMSGAVLGLAAGVVIMTIVMLLWNYIITPGYMGVDRSVVVGMMPTVFLPFNLIKGGINAALTLVLYKPIVGALRRSHLLPESTATTKSSFHLGFTIFSVALLVTFVLLFLALIGVL